MNLRDASAAAEAAKRLLARPPRSYVAFCFWLGVRLTPGQRVIGLVAFDGVQPRDLRGEERELARRIFGDVEEVPASSRAVFVAVCGARAGKSYTLVALRLLHLAVTADLSSLAPGEVASGPIFAPDKDLAAQDLAYVSGAVESSPLKSWLVRDVGEGVTLQRPDGKQVQIVVRAASGRGRTGRGRTLVGAALDECAFFRDANYQVNDAEIYKAIHPRIVPGGQVIIATTPWAEEGLAYEMHDRNYGHPVDAISAHAPTLVLRDTQQTREMVAREEASDPDNAAREYGALFMGAGVEAFFEPATIAACIDDALVPDEPLRPKPGEEVSCGGDLGFARNSTSLCVAHLRGAEAVIAELREWRPETGKPLKPSVVLREMTARVKWHHGDRLMADQHYRESAREHLDEAGMSFIDAPSTPADAFVRTRALMREQRVKLPRHPRFLAQLRKVRARKTSGGGLTIIQPKEKTGEHGDLVSAFVLAVYQRSGELVAAPAARVGTPEHNAALEREMEEARMRTMQRQQDEMTGNVLPQMAEWWCE